MSRGTSTATSAGSPPAAGETGKRRYHAEVVPWLWFLTRTSDCRIFAEQEGAGHPQAVFKDLDSAIKHPVESKLGSGYRQWTYCVQYRETDFNFVSRLMEQEGIFYYFKHGQSEHTLVLCDKAGDYKNTRQDRQVRVLAQRRRRPKSDVRHELGTPVSSSFPDATPRPTTTSRSSLPAASSIPTRPLDSSSPAKGRAKRVHQARQVRDLRLPGRIRDRNPRATGTPSGCMEEEEVAYDVADGSSLCEYLHAGRQVHAGRAPFRPARTAST